MTTETQQKYPNADASPERLRELEKFVENSNNRVLKREFMDNDAYVAIIYDLLAMLYERERHIGILVDTITQLKHTMTDLRNETNKNFRAFVDPQGDHKFE